MALSEYKAHADIGGGYSISAELPADGQLGKNSYTDASYNITTDLVSAIDIIDANKPFGTFVSTNNPQEIISSKSSLTITAKDSGIFGADKHNQTINLSDVSLLSSNVGTVFATSTTPLDYRDENLASKLVTQRITGNFKTIKADIVSRNYQFGVSNDFFPGALIYNNGGLQIVGESEENPGGHIEKLAISSTVTSSKTARGVAIYSYGSGPTYFTEQQIYMPIDQIGEEDNRFGAGIASIKF